MAKRLTDRQHNISELLRLYRITHLEVQELLRTAKTQAQATRRRAILNNVDAILSQTESQTRNWVNQNIPTIYKEGADQGVQTIKKAGATARVAEGFGVIHQEAIAAIADDAFLAFAEGLRTVRNTARGTLQQAARLQIRDEIAKGSIEGLSRATTSKEVSRILKDRGIIGLVDRGGKRWQLDVYARMLVRAKQREAFNAGTMNRLVENGFDLVQISDHAATDSCSVWEGKVVSLTGATKGYPLLTEVEGDSTHMFKPNCRHTFSAFIPGLSDR